MSVKAVDAFIMKSFNKFWIYIVGEIGAACFFGAVSFPVGDIGANGRIGSDEIDNLLNGHLSSLAP